MVIPQRSMFAEGPEPNRQEFLSEVFSTPRKFEHYGVDFYFQPDPTMSAPDGLLGRIGRQVVIGESMPPSEGFGDATHLGWKTCILAVDPGDHPDGQKASIELNPVVGKPAGVMRSLVKSINESVLDPPYLIEVEPIVDAGDFWAFADENVGEITNLTFEFIVPNGLWSADTNIKEELRVAREKTGAQKVVTTFKSEEGINTNSDAVHEAVDYAVSGSGEIRARTRRGKRFNSANKPKSVKIDGAAITGSELMAAVANSIMRVLGR